MEKQIIKNASLKVLQKKTPQDQGAAKLDTVQDFLIKLGIKPRLQINFYKCNFLKTFKVLCFLKMCPIFVSFVHNFGRSDNDMI